MTSLRWRQRFENFKSAHSQLKAAIKANQDNPENELIILALIKSFEISFELAWKTLKDYLYYNGIEVKLPREVIKQAFANDLLTNGQIWIDMLDDRNLMSHTYDKAMALSIVEKIRRDYFPQIEELTTYLEAQARQCGD